MEYHLGICVKDSKYIADHYNYIVILAGEGDNDNNFSFFVKIFNKNESIDNNVQNIKFGDAVFFTSEKEVIIDIYDVDHMVGLEYKYLILKDIHLQYYNNNGFSVAIKNQYGDYIIKNVINKVETDLIASLYKMKLYNIYLNDIQQITSENLQKIIKEEESNIKNYDIEDIINTLQISYYASNFYTRTDEPEAYKLYERRSFKNTKYENYKFDTYLFQVLKPGDWCIGDYEGWFYAREEAKEDIEYNTREISFLKNNMIKKYSKSEHLNYRVRTRLLEFLSPLFTFLTIQGGILSLNERYFRFGDFSLSGPCENKELILSRITRNNKLIKNKKEEFKIQIFKNLYLQDIMNEWCIPNPI